MTVKENCEKTMRILSIDVGLVNLGLVEIQTTLDNENIESIIFADRIDLTNLPHTIVSREQCTLYHTADAVDRVKHLIQEYQEHFDRASVVLVERQPLGGLVHVEQLLYEAFRDKTILCSPSSMHKHFHLPRGDYDGRKQRTVEIAQQYLSGHTLWIEKNDRLHDVADALCIALWWLHNEKRKRQEQINKEQFEYNRQQRLSKQVAPGVQDMNTFFDQYRYNSDTVTTVRTVASFLCLNNNLETE